MEELERWREAGIEVGRKLGVVQERERIIKLLEDNAMTYNLVAINGEILKQTTPLAAPLDKVIALIKGENK